MKRAAAIVFALCVGCGEGEIGADLDAATDVAVDVADRLDVYPSDAEPETTADAAPPDVPSAPITYANPVLAQDFPDPTVIRGSDRQFYAFATGGLLQRAKSSDLVHWTVIGNALSAKPSWASAKNNFWAPHVVEHDGTYYLYFSAEQNEGSGSFCVGVATSKSADGAFVDAGAPIVCGASFVNIDPMAYDDDATGKRLLYWGSGFAPIRAQELAADRVHLAAGSSATNLLVPSKYEYERLIEGAWLHRHDGTYYLFSSGDDCCGSATAPPHYAVMVARAKNALGPYEDLAPSIGAPDNTILTSGARFYAPGHNAVVVDDAGTEWLVYHAFDKTSPGARMMLIDPIGWDKGWPTIAGHAPSEGTRPGPVIKP
jgi:arabinan endo-1,5-alpha-L-arabinosidase